MSQSSASSVAATLRQRILMAELSQTDLGRRLGLSQAAVSRRMQGLAHWRANELEKLASILQTTLSELVTPLPVTPPAPADSVSESPARAAS